MTRALVSNPALWLPIALALTVGRPQIAAAQDDEFLEEEAPEEGTPDAAPDDAAPDDGTDDAADEEWAEEEADEEELDEEEPEEEQPEEEAEDKKSKKKGRMPSDQAGRDTAAGVSKVGSRAAQHTVPRTLVPVAILSGRDLAGLTGSDLINAAAIHGLGPDRVLVLINGKRRHQMAQVNLDETVGKGSSGVDLNAIPMAAVERVEILTDSASASYGPNAMGGVINIVLKERGGVQFDVTGGNYFDNDGNAVLGLDRASASVNAGFNLKKGFLNVTLSGRDRGETNRAGIATVDTSVDGRAFGGNWWTDDGTCPADEFAPDMILPCKKVRRLRFGNQDGQDVHLFYNGGFDVSKDVSLYNFGGISARTGNTGAGLYLGTGNGRVPAELYPDGTLPSLETTVDDAAFVLGSVFGLGGSWDLDLSLGWGRNSFSYNVEDSANVSWYYEPNPATGEVYGTSPTSAYAGKLINTEVTVNAEVTGTFDVLEDLDLAVGVEVRSDNYEIRRGSHLSYSYGRNNVLDPSMPIRNLSSFPLVEDVVGGIQGFAGFDPSSEVDDGRTAWDVYVDAEQNLAKWWVLGGALRLQNVQFTGPALVAKLATRVDMLDFMSLRGSASNGSRPPGVQQIYYSQRTTAILPVGLTETVTVGDANPLRSAFGMGQLKPETSRSGSAGLVFHADKPGGGTKSVKLTVDGFHIVMKDRIILSESVTGEVPAGSVDSPGRQLFRDLLIDNQLGAAQFFANAVDTKTSGVDVGSVWSLAFSGFGLDLGASVNYSETSITGGDPSSQLVDGADLFGPIQQNRTEKGQPRLTASIGQATTYKPITFRLSFNHVGSVTGKNYMALEDEKVWGAKWLTDTSISYAMVPELVLTVGADNLFDVLPDKWGEVGREYPEIGYTYGLETLPFGVNGGFYYANLSLSVD